MSEWSRFKQALADEPLPCALLDLDALEHNADLLMAAMADSPVRLRVATKSLRVPWVMHWLAKRYGERLCGWMTFSVHETAWLATQGLEDFLVAYPVARADEAAAFARMAEQGIRAIAMVDCAEHVSLLSEAAGDTPVRVCIDVDASWRPLPGLHLGVRRSPIRTPEQAVALARQIDAEPGVVLAGVMAYEAQVAGLPDSIPGENLLKPARVFIKSRSRALVAERRCAIVRALTEAGWPPEIINGGGTGSIRSTAFDGSCTETTVGSGYYCPTSFDGYDDLDLKPAALFALSVVRASDPGFVTCAGGGYIASGSAGTSRWPSIHLPQGLTPVAMEGFGEVQTPLARDASAPPIGLGDPVVCRHTKAGELMERFSELLLLRGDHIVDRVPTYRASGARYF